MAIDTTVAFRGLPPSAALREDIRRHAEKLARFAPRLQSCDVAVRRCGNRHRQGSRYLVHVHATLPGRTFEAGGGGASADRRHEDAYIAAHDAFDALRRQLEDHVRIRRGEVKAHLGDGRTATPA